MKQKLTLLLIALLTTMGAWAALSSSSIAKSGNVTDTWNITSALPTDNWTALSEAPAGITALGGTPFYRTQDITISDEGALSVTFLYTSGGHRLDILGVDLLNSSDEVVRSDYHVGYTGGQRSHNVYMIDHIASGNYKIRFIINNAGTTNSAGNITIKHINIKTANSFAEITQWYSIRMHSNQTHYMYYKSDAATGIGFDGSLPQNAYYLWGFVKDTDGIKIYNKAAGGSVAIDNATPCKLSADGTSIAFTFDTGNAGNKGADAGAYFSLYKNPTSGSKSYMNYQGDNINRWGGNDEGSTWMIDEVTFDAPFVAASEGKVYTIKAHFSGTEEYFTNNGTNLDFNTSATNGVNDYWILRSSGNGTYTWKFESGRGDGMFLSNNSDTEGLTSTGVYLQINTYGTYSELRGSNSGDAKTTGIVNLGTWSSASGNKGFGEYGVNCWSGSGHWTDEKWTTSYAIVEVQDVDIYTVISNINAGGVTYSEYTGKKDQTNGGFYILASEPSAGDFSAISVTDFTPGAITVNTTTKTITVNYSSSYSYTFTDVNGQEYTGTITGEFGVTPTLTGCDGYTLSNEVWDEGTNTYTADITFPFPVSSNDVTNWTYIGNFAGNSYTTSRFCWYVKSSDATKIYGGQDDLPTNESNELEKWEWSIIPACSSGAFSFTIKNASTNKFVTMAETPSAGFTNQITLTNSGTSFTFDNHRWKLPTKDLYISQNSSTADEQEVGVYTAKNVYDSNHVGNDIAFITPADFATLMADLKTAYTSYMAYFDYFTAGTYTQSVDGKMETAYANNGNVQKAIADPPTKYLKASEFNTYTNAYNDAVAGLRYVMPSGKFIRIKNVAGTKYVKDLDANYNEDETLDFTEGGTDAASIFYVDASNKMIAYKSGLYLFATNNTPRITLQSYADTYEFLKGSAALQVYIHSANNPIGWGGDNRYWMGNGSKSKIDRVATPTTDSNFLIEEVTSLPITMNLSDGAYYATIKLPVAVVIPDGLSAYSAVADGTTLTLTKVVENGVLAANTPVILYSESDVTTLDISNDTGASPAGTNELSGTIDAASVTANANYVLSSGSEGVGFYKYNNTVMPGFRAYLPSSATSNVKAFTFSFEDVEDAIRAIESENSNLEIYDIAGRRVQKAQKGLYIVNGKKVMYN